MKEKKLGTKTMNEVGFIPKLGETLEELKATRNALAVEAKIRPTTINDIVSGNAKQFNFETLALILEALNRISGDQKKHNVTDIFEYDFDKKENRQEN